MNRSILCLGVVVASIVAGCGSKGSSETPDGSSPFDAGSDGATSLDSGGDAPVADAARDAVSPGDGPLDATPLDAGGLGDAAAEGGLDASRSDAAEGGIDSGPSDGSILLDSATDSSASDGSPTDSSADTSSDGGLLFDAGADARGDASSGADAAADTTASADSGPSDGTPASAVVHLTGSAAKGPFASGAALSVSLVSSQAVPLDAASAVTSVFDDLGEFGVSVNVATSAIVDISATGEYFNEVEGAASSLPVTLEALANVGNLGAGVDTATANVNLVTHLAAGRIRTLLGDGGSSFDVAVARAESEVYAALMDAGMASQPDAAGISLALFGGDAASSAYLLALSAIVEQIGVSASLAGTGSVDEDVQTAIVSLASDFETNGTLSSVDRSAFAGAQACVRPSAVMASMTSLFGSAGATSPVPDINLALDTDGDGVVNDSDDCLLVANPTQSLPNAICSFTTPVAPEPFRTDAGVLNVSGSNKWAVGPVRRGDGGAVVNDVVQIGSTASGVELVVWLNNGDGTFALPTGRNVSASLGLDGGTDPQLVAARLIDMDNDGNTDLFVDYSEGTTIGFLKGDGTGKFPTFSAISTLADDAGAGGFGTVALGDLNGDGRPDVAASGLNDTSVAVLLSKPDGGGWNAASQLALPGGSMTIAATAIADWNNDHHNDVIVGGSSGFYFITGDGLGGFTVPPSPWAGLQPLYFDVADFDGDGALDIVATTGTLKLPGPFNVQWGDSSLSPSASPYTVSSSVSSAVCAPAACGRDFLDFVGTIPFLIGDATGDGYPDILVPISTAVVVSNGPLRTFVAPSGLAAAPNVCGGQAGAPFADLNADGRADILAAPHTGSAPFVPVLLNVANVHTW